MTQSVSHLKALVVSDNTNLSNRLTTSLNDLGCRVSVYSKQSNNWDSDKDLLTRKQVLTSSFDYVFMIDLDPNRFRYLSVFGEILKSNSHKKKVLLLPYLQAKTKAELTNNFYNSATKDNFKIIFLGNIVDRNVPHFEKAFFYRNKFMLPDQNQKIYFSDSEGSINYLIENTFSFSSKDKAAYISKPFDTADIANQIENLDKVTYVCQTVFQAKVKEIAISDLSKLEISQSITDTNTSVVNKDSKPDPVEVYEAPKKDKTKNFSKTFKKVIKWFLPLFVLFVLIPIMFFALSLALTRFNVRDKGNTETTKYSSIAGSIVSNINTKIFAVYEKIPFIGEALHNTYRGSLLFQSINNIYINEANTSRLVTVLISSVLGNSVNDPEKIISSLQSELDHRYASIEFVKGDIRSVANNYGFTQEELNHLLTKDTEKILNTKEFISSLSDLLGSKSQKDYFVVVLNEDDINPSGGQIVSSAYLSFDKGRLSNFVTYEVDEIDKNTKGDRDTSGVGIKGVNSNFSNANTSIDTSENVKNILWYLDNSLDIQPDGVIFINEKLLNSVTETFSDDQNVYESDQDKGASLEDVINVLKEDETKLSRVLNIAAEGLRHKDVYIWFTDPVVQNVFNKLKYSNNYYLETCDTCNEQLVSVIETKLSGDSNSSELSRSAEIDISFQEKLVKNKLVFEYQSLSDKTQDIYFQLIINKNASFSPFKVINGEESFLVKPETYSKNNHKVAGVPIKISDKTIIEIDWEYPLETLEFEDPYLLRWISQSGVEDYPLRVVVDGESVYDLTESTNGRYNTDSSPDTEIELKEKWIK